MGKTILLVDDEPSVLGIIKLQLESHGYQVLTSETGHGAVATVQRMSAGPEFPLVAVLLDLGLKDMNGVEVLRKIKALRPSVPVIIVTGSYEENEARLAMELGALEYITKPIDFNYLLTVLSAQE